MPNLVSVTKLQESLKIDLSAAKQVRNILENFSPKTALDSINDLFPSLYYGVEYINSKNNTGGIWYLNTGETYDVTLLYDTRSQRFFIGNWGDRVERYPARF